MMTQDIEELRRIVKQQSGIDDDALVDRAIEANGGDAVAAICDLIGIEDGSSGESSMTRAGKKHSKAQEDIREFRGILEEKDAIFFDYMQKQRDTQQRDTQQIDGGGDAEFYEHMQRREAEIEEENRPPKLPEDDELLDAVAGAVTEVEERLRLAELEDQKRKTLPTDDALMDRIIHGASNSSRSRD